MSKNVGCCRRFFLMVFCCKCCSKKTNLNALKIPLLPKNDETRGQIEKNELYMYGNIPSKLEKPILLQDFVGSNDTNVFKMACGNTHCLILLANNELYGFGGNEEGQLGMKLTSTKNKLIDNLMKIDLYSSIKSSHLEKIIKSNYHIDDIAAGDNYSLILLSHPNSNDPNKYIIKFGINFRDKYRSNLKEINTIVLEKNLPEVEIKRILAFGKRKIITSEDNRIFMSGIDFYSNKIDNYVEIKFESSEVQKDKNFKIKDISLGENHCIILTEEGMLYGIGDNTYGEMGKGNYNLKTFSPIIFESDTSTITPQSIRKIACGARHTLILLDSGKLYCMGDNSERQCFGELNRIETPTLIEFLGKDVNKDYVVDCFCGYSHNLVVMNNGDVLTWGDASNNKLGCGKGYFTVDKPTQILNLNQKCINNVCCGNQMTVVSTGKFTDSISHQKDKNIRHFNVANSDKVPNDQIINVNDNLNNEVPLEDNDSKIKI